MVRAQLVSRVPRHSSIYKENPNHTSAGDHVWDNSGGSGGAKGEQVALTLQNQITRTGRKCEKPLRPFP